MSLGDYGLAWCACAFILVTGSLGAFHEADIRVPHPVSQTAMQRGVLTVKDRRGDLTPRLPLSPALSHAGLQTPLQTQTELLTRMTEDSAEAHTSACVASIPGLAQESTEQ